MSAAKNSELKVIQTNAALAEMPDFLKSEIGNQAGMENVEQGDLLLPRLGLCQDLSPQKRPTHATYIPGLEVGMLFNTVTQEIYGHDLEIILLFFFKNRIKYFPIKDGGGIDCISVNGIDGGRIRPDGCSFCAFSKFGNGATDDEHGNEPPLCTGYHNYMGWIPGADIPSPIAVSYKSTGLKESKELLAKIRLTRVPMYAKRYKISSTIKRDGNNEWYGMKVEPVGFVDQELFKQMESNFTALKAMNIKMDTTGESEEDASFNHGEKSNF